MYEAMIGSRLLNLPPLNPSRPLSISSFLQLARDARVQNCPIPTPTKFSFPFSRSHPFSPPPSYPVLYDIHYPICGKASRNMIGVVTEPNIFLYSTSHQCHSTAYNYEVSLLSKTLELIYPASLAKASVNTAEASDSSFSKFSNGPMSLLPFPVLSACNFGLTSVILRLTSRPVIPTIFFNTYLVSKRKKEEI